MELTFIATAPFGLEKIVKIEIENLGYEVTKVENGKVEFQGEARDIPILNMWLRVADRLLIKVAEFKATTFEELFQGVKKQPWQNFIGPEDKFPVDGKSVKSTLYSISDCQAITKKAIVEKLKTKYDVEWFKETKALYKVEVSLLKDIATLTIDTSGDGLHKRGYREIANQAPVKETLAAAMVMISRWREDRVLIDPFCGSGTIAIEAAMIGKNIAPGLQRTFVSQNWPIIPENAWKDAKTYALKAIKQDVDLKIMASDIDPKTIKIAMDNAYNAGVDECIEFKTQDMGKIYSPEEYGYIITNPPYGERLGEKAEVQRLYKRMGKGFERFKTWSKYIITSDEELEKLYGKRADKKRKLFNGRIKVDYYQFFGPKPPKEYFNK